MTKQRKLIWLLVAYLFVGVLVIQAAAGGPSAAQAEIVCDPEEPGCEEGGGSCNNTTCSGSTTCSYSEGSRCQFETGYVNGNSYIKCSSKACSTNG